jgi:imidazoleglycerol phosphate synthase glutamine amidotransferase subunit HisH
MQSERFNVQNGEGMNKETYCELQHQRSIRRSQMLGAVRRRKARARAHGSIAPTNPRRHKVPHLGWNSLTTPAGEPSLLAGVVPERRLFYFANAYAIAPASAPSSPEAHYTHDQPWLALVQQGSIHAVQFHPEKSRVQGLQLLRNFLEAVPC